MQTLGPELWQKISPFLDEALELPQADRAAWLESFRQQRPELGDLLQDLLKEHVALEQERFLGGPSPHQVFDSLAGQRIGAYTLISRIGEGGMGSVWLAERSDGRFDRRVAVKLVNGAVLGRGGEERFKREGSILGRLAHEHIAELVDAGVSGAGQAYLVLEYVEGEQIDQYFDGHSLDVQERVRLFLDVLDAIAHAHSNLIVHRDIKPSNVLIRKDGQVKLLDFGIAKLLEGDGRDGAATMLTAGRAMTLEYAAPEQVTGAPVTTATDVYALGVLLYVLLTGRHPARALLRSPGMPSAAQLVKIIVETDPTRPSDIVNSTREPFEETTSIASKRMATPEKLSRLLRGDLDTIVLKTLKKNPRERYGSVTALADDLHRYLKHEPIGVRPDTFAYRAAKFVRRNRTVAALSSLAVLLTVAGISGILLQTRAARATRLRLPSSHSR